VKDVFISYINTDRPWAEWIAWVLEENGYTVIIQAWKSPEGKNTLWKWRNAIVHSNLNTIENSQLIVVLSKTYLQAIISERNTPVIGSEREWAVALATILQFQDRSLIPIRIEDIELTELLASVVYVDLFDKSEAEAEQAILAALEDRPDLDSPLSLETTQTQTGQIEIESQFDMSNNDQPKQQRRSHTVQFFLEQLTDNIGIEMMLIPAGTFMMGSPEDEIDRSSNESPQHAVNVSTFFMGKYPITQAQWRFVAELPQVNQKLEPNPSYFREDKRPVKRPVEQVSWYNAVEFCDRLSVHTGRSYRLPSEAEWEYACRASSVFKVGVSKAGNALGNGASTPFHFGETITTDLANYRGTDEEQFNWSGSYGRGPKGKYRGGTTPVDHFGIANVFGLCDMHGNVWEWCLDHWHENYKGAPTDGSAWISEVERASRMLRGGSWDYGPRSCRSAYRNYTLPVNRHDDIGFRVVCSAPRT
jgi:formylglycine-generating enzyme required for sulfatase activity